MNLGAGRKPGAVFVSSKRGAQSSGPFAFSSKIQQVVTESTEGSAEFTGRYSAIRQLQSFTREVNAIRAIFKSQETLCELVSASL
jgi:hypothetical protein